MKIKIEVTADDIRRGVMYNPNSCPYALACRRALNIAETDGVSLVGSHVTDDGLHLDGHITVYFNKEARLICRSLPHKMDKNISRFDRRLGMEPNTVELDFIQVEGKP